MTLTPRRFAVVTVARVALVLAALLAAKPARAEDEAVPVRRARPVSIGLAIPDLLRVKDRDPTLPLPALHLGVNVSPRLSVEFDAGGLRLPYSAYHALLGMGAKGYLFEGPFSPTVVARAGRYFTKGEEGGDRSYSFISAGLGFEYARTGGFFAWGDASAAAIRFNDGGEPYPRAGLLISLGLGYRIGMSATRAN